MTSKERVIKAINHEIPDRVPIGEWGVDHDHVSKILGRHTYWRNRRDTTIALWEGRRDEVVESLKYDYSELIEKLDYDIIVVEKVAPKGYKHPDPPRKIAEGVWEDSKGNIYKYAASNDSIQCITHSEGKEEISNEDIDEAYANIANEDESVYELIDYIGNKYGKEKAIVGRDVDIYGCLMAPFGGDYNHQLIMTSLAPDEIKKMYAPCLEQNKKLLDRYAAHNVLIAMQGQDFGMNSGCIISPTVLREVFFPFIQMVNQEIANRNMVPFFHCCGNIWDIIEDFIQSGYKGYQSIQKSAGMDWKKLKDRYGSKLTLWTGIQCETLISGTMEETEKEVRQALKDLMPGGGFIFGSTNTVQFGSNTDNYLKALEIARKEGVYR